MLRLLILLLRQRLHRARATGAEGVVGTVPMRRWPVVVGLLALALGIAAYAAVGQWRERRALQADPPTRLPIESATLHLRVVGVESPPLLVYIDGPGADEPKGGDGAPPTVHVTSVGSVFQPAFQVAPLAARVQVGNADPIAHNTHVFAGRHTLFNVALPMQGVPVTRVLGRAGLFDVRCDLHAWMRATVFVPPNPHHAVIREAGEIMLRDIAPGSWRLHVWSPATGESVQFIDLPPGATRTIDLPAR
jgi:hypothetical protein